MVDFYKFAAPLKSIGVGKTPGPKAPIRSGVKSVVSPIKPMAAMSAPKATAPTLSPPPAPVSPAQPAGAPSSIWSAVAPRAPQATVQAPGSVNGSVQTIQDKPVVPARQTSTSVGKQDPNAPQSLQSFQENLEKRQPGAIANSRAKVDASTFAAKGINAPEYQVRPGMSFTPTNKEQAERMGAMSPSGNFVGPTVYQHAQAKRERGYARVKNETTGATAGQDWAHHVPGQADLENSLHQFPKAPEAPKPLAPGQGVKKVSSQTLFDEVASQIIVSKLIKLSAESQVVGKSPAANIQTPIASTPPQAEVAPRRDWNAEPAKPVTYGGQPIDQTPSAGRLARDAEFKKLTDSNSEIINRQKATDANLFSRVGDLKRQLGQQRADQMNGMSQANNKIDRSNKVIDYAEAGVPRSLITDKLVPTKAPTQVTASQGYEDLQRDAPHRPTVSQLEKLYRGFGFGLPQTERALEALVDESGQGVRGDREAWLRRNSLRLNGKLPKGWKPEWTQPEWARPEAEEPDSGVSSFYDSVAAQ